MRENKAAVWAGQTAGSKALPFQAQALSELQASRWTWGQLAPRAVYVQSGRRYANRTMRPLPQLCPQGAHIPVLTARFPLQGALQTLPVTGREPDTQRSPQTTPPRELLTQTFTAAMPSHSLVERAKRQKLVGANKAYKFFPPNNPDVN